jgi:hypothetical protein
MNVKEGEEYYSNVISVSRNCSFTQEFSPLMAARLENLPLHLAVF